jgi:hypothetical protein
MSVNQSQTLTPVGKASIRTAMGLFATGVTVPTTSHQGQYRSPKARRNDSAASSGRSATDSDLARDLGITGIEHGDRDAESCAAEPDVGAADMPDDLNTDDVRDFADDDIWIE